MSKEAMKLALEALEYIEHNYMSLPAPAEKAITALREALVNEALNKKAENARELGLDYEPAEVLGHNGWGFPIKAAAPVQEDWGPGPHECHSLTAASVQEPVAWRYRGILHDFDPSDWAEGPVTPLYTTPPAPVVPDVMTKDEALDLALEALELNNSEWKSLADSGDAGFWSAEEQEHYKQTEAAITAIKQVRALDKKAENARELGLDYAPAQQEPVDKYSDIVSDGGLDPRNTAPPQRTWVGLTDEERHACTQSPFTTENYRAIEAKLKEKNT